jgi:hypothetical protein
MQIRALYKHTNTLGKRADRKELKRMVPEVGVEPTRF